MGLRVNSNLDRSLAVDRIRVMMGDGTVVEFSTGTATYVRGTTTYTATVTPAVTRTITSAKSSESFVAVVPVSSLAPSIASVEVLVRDPASGATQWIRAVGGVSI